MSEWHPLDSGYVRQTQNVARPNWRDARWGAVARYNYTPSHGQREAGYMWQWAQGLAEEEWLRFLAGEISIPGHVPPPMPPEEIQQSWVGASGIVALRGAGVFLRRLKKHMAEAGTPLRRGTRALDFGVGWGRIYRLLMRELDDLTGIDPDQP